MCERVLLVLLLVVSLMDSIMPTPASMRPPPASRRRQPRPLPADIYQGKLFIGEECQSVINCSNPFAKEVFATKFKDLCQTPESLPCAIWKTGSYESQHVSVSRTGNQCRLSFGCYYSHPCACVPWCSRLCRQAWKFLEGLIRHIRHACAFAAVAGKQRFISQASSSSSRGTSILLLSKVWA